MAPSTRGTTPGSVTSARSVRAGSQIQHSLLSHYSAAWEQNFKAQDPVFGSRTSLTRLETELKRSLQPVEHCQAEYFPNVAAKFGLKRYLQTKDLSFGNKGPRCAFKCSLHSKCWPTFMFQSDKLKNCHMADKAGQPTLVPRYTIEKARENLDGDYEGSVLVCMACWFCWTKQRTGCPIIGKRLHETSDGGSVYRFPDEQESNVANDQHDHSSELSENDDEGDQGDHSGNITPTPANHRKASQTDFPVPDAKKSAIAAPTTSTIAPLTASALAASAPALPRPGRAYLLKKRQGSVAPSVASTSADDDGGRSFRPSKILVDPTASTSMPPPLLSASHGTNHSQSDADVPASSQLPQLRSRLESCFTQATSHAEEHLARARAQETESKAIMQELFVLCRQLEKQATDDRDAIDRVRADSVRIECDLRTMEGRVAKYSDLVAKKDQSLHELVNKVDFVEKQLSEARQEQVVVDRGLATAVKAKELAIEHRDEALEARGIAEERLAEAVQAKLLAEVQARVSAERLDEAEAALEDATNETDEVKRQMGELDGRLRAIEYEAGTGTQGGDKFTSDDEEGDEEEDDEDDEEEEEEDDVGPHTDFSRHGHEDDKQGPDVRDKGEDRSFPTAGGSAQTLSGHTASFGQNISPPSETAAIGSANSSSSLPISATQQLAQIPAASRVRPLSIVPTPSDDVTLSFHPPVLPTIDERSETTAQVPSVVRPASLRTPAAKLAQQGSTPRRGASTPQGRQGPHTPSQGRLTGPFSGASIPRE